VLPSYCVFSGWKSPQIRVCGEIRKIVDGRMGVDESRSPPTWGGRQSRLGCVQGAGALGFVVEAVGTSFSPLKIRVCKP
jgi:hypothetical protein